ncbi:hypothetical protein F4810DRAFT_708885 [Camillea tinctor]|nr:hypothetical protein F4810DRAFT_708885 [Camillea tinctor]
MQATKTAKAHPPDVTQPPTAAIFVSWITISAAALLAVLLGLLHCTSFLSSNILPRGDWATASKVTVTSPEVATIGALQAGTFIAAVHPINASAVTVSCWNTEDDDAAYVTNSSFAGKIAALAATVGASLGYIFMNATDTDQPVIASYREANVHRLQVA